MIRILVSIAIVALGWLPSAAHADRRFSWDEEVLLSDGSRIWMRRDVRQQTLCHPSLPGSCQILGSVLKTAVPGIGTVHFEWKGHEWPVVFDVIGGRPWIVLPIAGLELCEKYGNPPESVAAFVWASGAWNSRPYREAPGELKLNLTRWIPSNDQTRITVEAKYQNRESGVTLDKGFIPQHAKWEHSCHRLNPPTAPEYERALREYSEAQWNTVVGKVVETREDSVALALHEDRALFGMPGDKRDIIGCEGKVSHKHSIFSTRKVEGGTSGTLTAFRIALGSEPAQTHAIFIPAKVADRWVHISRVTCTATLIYVLLMEQRDIVAVLAYDLEGNRKNAWRIRIPDPAVSDRNWGSVIEFADRADRFDVVIGEYQHHGGTRGATVATLGKRYVIDAPKR